MSMFYLIESSIISVLAKFTKLTTSWNEVHLQYSHELLCNLFLNESTMPQEIANINCFTKMSILTASSHISLPLCYADTDYFWRHTSVLPDCNGETEASKQASGRVLLYSEFMLWRQPVSNINTGGWGGEDTMLSTN